MKKRHNPYDIHQVMEKHGLSEYAAIERIEKLKKSQTHTLENYILKYGDDVGRNRFSAYRQKILNRSNPYSVTDVMEKYSICEKEAESMVLELKTKTAGNLQSFIKRHGEVDGRIMYTEFCKKSAHTIETFIEKYGEAGCLKYVKYLETKESRSDNYYQRKHGLGWEIKKQADMSAWVYQLSLKGYIEKYGESVGTEKYNAMIASRGIKRSDYVAKYGERLGNELCDRHNYYKDSVSLEVCIERFGEEAGLALHKKRIKDCSGVLYELRKLYGNEEGMKIYDDFKAKTITSESGKQVIDEIKKNKYARLSKYVNTGIKSNVSSQVNSFFDKLSKLKNLNLSYGKRCNELRLFDPIGLCHRYFDSVDEELKLIIEFNGSAFHYHESFPKDWVSLFGKTADESLEYDSNKIKLAQNNGYTVLSFWDFQCSNKRKSAKVLSEIESVIDELRK